MKQRLLITVSIFLIALLATGCVPQYIEDTKQTDDQTESLTTSLSTPPDSEDYILASKSDLSERFGINIEEINIIYIKAVTWSDTSLGCPQEDMEYAQVITEGYQILLEAIDNVYEYHTDSHDNVILCALAPSGEVSIPNEDTMLEDGGPNQPKDSDVIITTPTKSVDDANVQDGWPNQPKETDVVITTPIK
jgi:hypothetical protein